MAFEDRIPDGTTLWLFREKLAKAGLIQTLFEHFGQHLEAKGYIARGGQMVDATIVPVPKQRNTREENEVCQARDKTSADWVDDVHEHDRHSAVACNNGATVAVPLAARRISGASEANSAAPPSAAINSRWFTRSPRRRAAGVPAGWKDPAPSRSSC